ncbi:MAG: DUF1697 domain-containing protein [Solirubrobacteraceae bacterium]
MRALMADSLGYGDVQTHLQSGNVIFSGAAGGDEPRIAAAIEREFGFAVDVLTRSGRDLEALVAANPLAAVAGDPARQLVVFLSGEPERAGVAALHERDIHPDVLQLAGRELHLWCPAGVRNSPACRLALPRVLGVWGTARNWRTVERLLELCRSA